jgi:sulfite exporter TauE/SafE
VIELAAGLALGLAGSLHCAGMCGPIALALPRTGRRAWAEVAQRLTYQFGRVTTYTTLGAIVGIGGNAIALSGYGRTLSIVAGIVMLFALALQLLWGRELIRGHAVERAIAPLKRSISRLLTKHGASAHFAIGLLNGLLPCGLVTAAMLGALGTGSLRTSAIFMLGFGLGTLPVMSAISIGGAKLSCHVRQRLRYAAPVIGVVVATLFLLRGMALGIPHVSPVKATAAHPASCCEGHPSK